MFGYFNLQLSRREFSLHPAWLLFWREEASWVRFRLMSVKVVIITVPVMVATKSGVINTSPLSAFKDRSIQCLNGRLPNPKYGAK